MEISVFPCSEHSFHLELRKRERNPSQSHVKEIPNYPHHLSQGGTCSTFPYYPEKDRGKLGMVFFGTGHAWILCLSCASDGILPPPEFSMENLLGILQKLDSSSNSDVQN